jgi:hypothetical protein
MKFEQSLCWVYSSKVDREHSDKGQDSEGGWGVNDSSVCNWWWKGVSIWFTYLIRRSILISFTILTMYVYICSMSFGRPLIFSSTGHKTEDLVGWPVVHPSVSTSLLSLLLQNYLEYWHETWHRDHLENLFIASSFKWIVLSAWSF